METVAREHEEIDRVTDRLGRRFGTTDPDEVRRVVERDARDHLTLATGAGAR